MGKIAVVLLKKSFLGNNKRMATWGEGGGCKGTFQNTFPHSLDNKMTSVSKDVTMKLHRDKTM